MARGKKKSESTAIALAERAIHTGSQFAAVMSALLTDTIAGRVEPQVALSPMSTASIFPEVAYRARASRGRSICAPFFRTARRPFRCWSGCSASPSNAATRGEPPLQ